MHHYLLKIGSLPKREESIATCFEEQIVEAYKYRDLLMQMFPDSGPNGCELIVIQDIDNHFHYTVAVTWDKAHYNEEWNAQNFEAEPWANHVWNNQPDYWPNDLTPNAAEIAFAKGRIRKQINDPMEMAAIMFGNRIGIGYLRASVLLNDYLVNNK